MPLIRWTVFPTDASVGPYSLRTGVRGARSRQTSKERLGKASAPTTRGWQRAATDRWSDWSLRRSRWPGVCRALVNFSGNAVATLFIAR